MFNNAEWNESHIGFVGLPRPFSKVLEQHQISQSLASKVPIPWQSRAQNNQDGFLRIVQENEDIVYSKNLCSYCGVKINNDDNVVRWKNKELDKMKHDGRFVLSDIHPLHLNCMKQTRVYCPGMKKKRRRI